MNPILKKLAQQAGFSTELSEAMATRHNTTSGLEKFAELIILESARVAVATPCPITDEISKQSQGHTWDAACIEAATSIRKHFGITPKHHAASEWPREL